MVMLLHGLKPFSIDYIHSPRVTLIPHGLQPWLFTFNPFRGFGMMEILDVKRKKRNKNLIAINKIPKAGVLFQSPLGGYFTQFTAKHISNKRLILTLQTSNKAKGAKCQNQLVSTDRKLKTGYLQFEECK